MPFNYVDSFQSELQQKYTRELTSSALTTNNAQFINAKTIKIPRLTLGGYKNHNRSGGWNRQDIANDFEAKVLSFDRNVEFYVDAMDVDETNQGLSAANTTNVFETEQAIPELDKYRYSKLFTEWTGLGKSPVTTALTTANILSIFDTMMTNMDEAEVPMEGRILYVTPQVDKLLKEADQLQRQIQVSNNNGQVNRKVVSLDDVTITKVPSSRLKTVYDFTNGAVPGVGAKQINMILVHPNAVLAPVKHQAIHLWEPGTHTGGDGYLYQNRRYTDLFVIERKADAIAIHKDA